MGDRLRPLYVSSEHVGSNEDYPWLVLNGHASSFSAMKDLDLYLADLYEGIDAKVRATGLVFTLATRTEWLNTLATHGSAVGAIARVLREEGRKSFSLRFNILSIFFMFSLFQKFHQMLLEQKVGKTTLTIMALEVQRSELQWTVEGGFSLSEPGISKRERSVAATASVVQMSKQERLLYMSVHLLFNIAEDILVEKKMKKHKLVENLCKLLNRKNVSLLSITVKFLKKLSIFEENKEKMKECGIIYRLSALLPCRHETLLTDVLRLLWNLSFDADLRSDMIKCKFLQTLEAVLNEKKLEHLVFGVLYNLSTDVEFRVKFAETDILSIALKLIVAQPMKAIPGELVALSLNLTCAPQTAAFSCECGDLKQLLTRAIRFNDPLLLKVVRNISEHEDIKSHLLDFIPALVSLLIGAEDSISLQVEILGILNNISSLKGSFDTALAETALIHFLHSRFQLGNKEDDLLLEIAIFVGGICSEETALLISRGGLVHKLSVVFMENRHDTELALQLLYTFGQFLLTETTTKDLLTADPKVVIRILDLSQDHNPEVAKMAEILVSTISEIDDDWRPRLVWLRFPRLTIGRFLASPVMIPSRFLSSSWSGKRVQQFETFLPRIQEENQ